MKELKKGPAVAAILGLIAFILLYNCWSYFSGRCTFAMMLESGPVAPILLVCIFLAAIVLITLRSVRSDSSHRLICRCGMQQRASAWHYCPECGQSLKREPSNEISRIKTSRR